MPTAILTAHRTAPSSVRIKPSGPFSALEGGSPLRGLTPNWFAAVMGTGIVANAAVTLPPALRPEWLLVAARGVWVLAALLLVVLLAATAAQWLLHRDVARSHLDHPVNAYFYGAPAMALMTVGAGAVLVGEPLLGAHVAVGLDAVLWTAGTAMGLATAVVLPVRAFTRLRVGEDAAFGGWLMPIVPPMVSAATGPLLVPHLPAGQLRLTMLAACLAMFGLSLLASVVVISLVWGRLARHGVGAAVMVPTLWIVLGPLGQSVTALHTMAGVLPEVTGPAQGPVSYDGLATALGVVVGLPVWGFAMTWLAIVVTITVRTARAAGGLPFAITWWSFTFPVGTLVTGTSGLAAATGSVALAGAAGSLYLLLVVAWVVVAARTARGAWTGALLPPLVAAGRVLR